MRGSAAHLVVRLSVAKLIGLVLKWFAVRVSLSCSLCFVLGCRDYAVFATSLHDTLGPLIAESLLQPCHMVQLTPSMLQLAAVGLDVLNGPNHNMLAPHQLSEFLQ